MNPCIPEEIERLHQFLHRLAPWVVLVGSYAREEETSSSDLDFYVRQKKQDPFEEPPVDTSYLPDIVELAVEFGYRVDSCCVGSITLPMETTGVIQLEFSYLYRIPKDSKVYTRTILKTPFLTCVDNKETPFSDCYEAIDASGNLRNPLPLYSR